MKILKSKKNYGKFKYKLRYYSNKSSYLVN